MLLFGVPASEPRTVRLLRGGADSLKQAEGCSGSKNWRTYRRTTKMPDASILHERLQRKRLLIVVGNSKIVHQVRDIEASFFDAIGQGYPTSTFALESGASFRVPVFFEAQKYQPLSASALEDDAL